MSSSTISALNGSKIASVPLKIQNISNRSGTTYVSADVNSKRQLHTMPRGQTNHVKTMDRLNFKDQSMKIQDGK